MEGGLGVKGERKSRYGWERGGVCKKKTRPN